MSETVDKAESKIGRKTASMITTAERRHKSEGVEVISNEHPILGISDNCSPKGMKNFDDMEDLL